MNAGAGASGVYVIDPDGYGGNDPVAVYCDMETDGGGWTLCSNTYGAGMAEWPRVTSGSFDSKDNVFSGLCNEILDASEMLLLANDDPNTNAVDSATWVVKLSYPSNPDNFFDQCTSHHEEDLGTATVISGSPYRLPRYICCDTGGFNVGETNNMNSNCDTGP